MVKEKTLKDAYRRWCYYEGHRSQYQKWREEHRREQASAIRKWKLANRERIKVYAKNRRDRELRVMLGFSTQEWEVKRSATKGICPSCRQFVGITKLTVDHIPPLSKVPAGTIYTLDMVQPICASCNSRKLSMASPVMEGCFW